MKNLRFGCSRSLAASREQDSGCFVLMIICMSSQIQIQTKYSNEFRYEFGQTARDWVQSLSQLLGNQTVLQHEMFDLIWPLLRDK